MKHLKYIILLAIGIFIIYWAMEHSPEAGLGQKISNELSGSYTMSEPWYYVSLTLGSLISFLSIVKIFKGMK
ncbi:MAG TPA: hypothetical protein PKL31_16865 [Fulvivirga sp.]|nr:hypothetical protein [Fulvivirga sp.]